MDEPGQVTNVSESLASGMRSSKKFEMPRIILAQGIFLGFARRIVNQKGGLI